MFSKKGKIIIAILAVIILLKLLSPEDEWLCVDGKWVQHGRPSSEQPTTGCGVASVSFDETGHFIKDNPGLKPGVWYLSYEKPGQPALYKELVFDDKSICIFNGNKGDCPDVLFPSSTLTQVRGELAGEVVRVVDAVSGVGMGNN